MAEEASVTVKIKGDASGGEAAVKKAKTNLERLREFCGKGLIGTLNAVHGAVLKVMGAFGLFGMAVQGVKAVIDAVRKLPEIYRNLHNWIHRAERALAESRMAAVFESAATAMDKLIARQATYNKLLKDELGDLGRRKELQGIERSGKERREDERREIARAKEIALAGSDEEERAIRQRWAVEDETRERGRTYRALKASAAEEDERAAIYGSKAGAAERGAADAQKAIVSLRGQLVLMTQTQREEAERQLEALEQRRRANAESAAEFRKEERQAEARAKLYRQQMEDVSRGGGVAQARNEQENAKIAREEFAERQRKARESDAAANEFVRGYAEEQEREEEKRLAGIADFESRVAGQDNSSRPKDRLTAMGLGSGAVIDRTAQNQARDVKTLVSLLKEQVNLTREKNQANVAVYAP